MLSSNYSMLAEQRPHGLTGGMYGCLRRDTMYGVKQATVMRFLAEWDMKVSVLWTQAACIPLHKLP